MELITIAISHPTEQSIRYRHIYMKDRIPFLQNAFNISYKRAQSLVSKLDHLSARGNYSSRASIILNVTYEQLGRYVSHRAIFDKGYPHFWSYPKILKLETDPVESTETPIELRPTKRS